MHHAMAAALETANHNLARTLENLNGLAAVW
jgi:hypothetical protein